MSVGRLRSLQQLTSLRLVSLTLQPQLQQHCQSHVRRTGFQSGFLRMFATGISKIHSRWGKKENQEGFFVAFLVRKVI